MASADSHQQPDLRPSAQGADGADLTLIRWMLTLTPMERLRHVEALAASCRALQERNGVRPRSLDELRTEP